MSKYPALDGDTCVWKKHGVPKVKNDPQRLYRVFTIALVLGAYGLTALLGGSGFFAIYLVGMFLGQRGDSFGGDCYTSFVKLTRFH